MKCPFTRVLMKDGLRREIPCGKCEVCLDNRRRDYTLRLNLAEKKYNSIYFITLTFNENELPFDRSECIRKFQLYMKRLRKSWPFNEKLKYFCVLERGDLNKRYHWHQILFSNCQATKEHILSILLDRWQYGIVDVGYLQPGGISYLTKYLFKDDYKMLISRGLGFPDFSSPNSEQELERMVLGYHINGYQYTCGNSIKNKLNRESRLLFNLYRRLRDYRILLTANLSLEEKQPDYEYRRYMVRKQAMFLSNIK